MQFLDEDIYQAVENNLDKVSSYVNSHGGGIKLLGVKNGTVYIELIGTCHGCSMSIMTTKMVVQRELRVLIHPSLNVINVDGTPENVLPEEFYTKVEADSMEQENKNTIVQKVTNLFK